MSSLEDLIEPNSTTHSKAPQDNKSLQHTIEDVTKGIIDKLGHPVHAFLVFLLWLIAAFLATYEILLFWGYRICPNSYLIILDRCNAILNQVVPPFLTYLIAVFTPNLQNHFKQK